MESGAARRYSKVLFTGPPGIGKTTLCKKIASILSERGVKVEGFYTEEVRSKERRRIGFDIVTLDKPAKRGVLARIENIPESKRDTAIVMSVKLADAFYAPLPEAEINSKPSKFRVGQYQVAVNDFEKIAVPTLTSNSDVLIIDEIGKMELFSGLFRGAIEKLFFEDNGELPRLIIATIPARDRVPQNYARFFDKFHENPSFRVSEVTRENRDNLSGEMLEIIEDILRN